MQMFFNYDPDYDNTLSLVVLQGDWDTFGGADALQERLMGRHVRVRGEISMYGDRMQLVLRNPSQIIEVRD